MIKVPASRWAIHMIVIAIIKNLTKKRGLRLQGTADGSLNLVLSKPQSTCWNTATTSHHSAYAPIALHRKPFLLTVRQSQVTVRRRIPCCLPCIQHLRSTLLLRYHICSFCFKFNIFCLWHFSNKKYVVVLHFQLNKNVALCWPPASISARLCLLWLLNSNWHLFNM